MPHLCCMLTMLLAGFLLHASASASSTTLRFNVVDTGTPEATGTLVEPWQVVKLDPDYGGQWVVAGDVDGDGAVEIVSAENHNEGDVHYTSAVVVHRLDGTVLWRWGDPGAGGKVWHHDVACQIHDWDGDGRNEVVVATDGAVVTLDGATGQGKERFSIPKGASDCLIFCDLSGAGRPTDVLVKNRYEQIWAYDRTGKLLWTVPRPGGHPTAHQPRPMDIDGDGHDEIMAGFALLNADGSVRWALVADEDATIDGHLDCARLMRRGDAPSDTRIAMTFCGGSRIALIDGHGNTIWAVNGHHFEAFQFGRIFSDVPGDQILVDIDHMPFGESPLWVLDEDGVQRGQIITDFSRHHRLVDWDGDGCAEIVVGGNLAIYNHEGRRVATLAVPDEFLDKDVETSVIVGDMTGNGVHDLLVVTPAAVFIFRNENKPAPGEAQPLGTGLNVTLY